MPRYCERHIQSFLTKQVHTPIRWCSQSAVPAVNLTLPSSLDSWPSRWNLPSLLQLSCNACTSRYSWMKDSPAFCACWRLSAGNLCPHRLRLGRHISIICRFPAAASHRATIHRSTSKTALQYGFKYRHVLLLQHRADDYACNRRKRV